MRCRATGCIAYKHTHLQTLSFIKREELVAFTVVVNTYYQLLVDANAIIMEGSLKPPERWFKVGENGGSLSPPISLPVCLSVCLSVCLYSTFCQSVYSSCGSCPVFFSFLFTVHSLPFIVVTIYMKPTIKLLLFQQLCGGQPPLLSGGQPCSCVLVFH